MEIIGEYKIIFIILIGAVMITSNFGITMTGKAESFDGNWVIETVDSVGSVCDNSLVLDSSDNPHIAYSPWDGDKYTLKYAKKTSSGWSTETIFSPSGRTASVDIDSNGRPHIAFRDNDPDDLMYAKKTSSGWDIDIVDTDGNLAKCVSLVLDSSNNPHIAYRDEGNKDLKYAKKTSSGWTIETVDSEGNVGEQCSIDLDSNNKPHIIYTGYASYDRYLKYAKWTGSSWLIETVDSNGDTGWENDIAVDSNNNVHVSYFKGEYDHDLRYAKRSGGSWTKEIISNNGGRDTSTDVDSNNKPHISCYDLDDHLVYWEKTSGSWSMEIVTSDGASCNPSIKLDSDNYPCISFHYDTSPYSLKYAKKTTDDSPTAHIDSISPNPATEGDTVHFNGYGEGGTITGYNWRSSRDGQLSTEPSFTTSHLSVGTHTIYFKVRNDEGSWSTEVSKSLTIKEEDSDPNGVPEWAIGNKWIYDFNFDFTYSILDISGAINNMKLEVIGIDEINDEYTLEITGELDTELAILGIIPGGSFAGDVRGIAHFEKSTLAIKDFVFECFGYYTIIETIAKVSMTFDPPFNFFDFPIEADEDENNPWSAETYATLNGNFKIGLIEYSFSTEGGFDGEELYLVREEPHTVNGQTFDCFLIRGSMGPSHGGSSKLWYSPEVGYLVDIQETIYDWEGVDAILSMPLNYTNYIIDNDPPNIPDKPSGDTALTAGEEYTYTASTSDEEGDNIYYKFDWGDETFSEWLGPYTSGRSVSESHRWVQTGVYNVRVKAKDTNEVESLWSEPLSITVTSELPTVTVNVYEIERIDDIDYSYPWDTMGYLAEWYYRVEAISTGMVSTDSYYSTHDHTKNGRWIHADYWKPNKDHELLTNSAEVIITIKLMDHDEWYEFGHDLADVSGCHGDGPDNEANTEKRGAIFHGTYNMVTNELNPYSEDPSKYSDYRKIQDGRYVTCGDYQPDNSNTQDENDALVRFWIYDTYEPPVADIDDPPQDARSTEEIQFMGKVTGGISTEESPYTWRWNFGDGETSTEQNPTHSYTTVDTYTVTLTVTDGFDQSDSDETTIEIVSNQPPNKPSKPSGETNGKTGKTYTYTSIATDPEGDKIYYKFDWGDDTDSGWIGAHESGEMGSASHKWDKRGEYGVRVKAKDEYNDESGWSDPLSVSMPKNKQLISLEAGIYVDNVKKISFPITIFVGDTDIEVDAEGASKVEFYIDEELEETVTEKPYIWKWDEFSFGRHTLKVIAYDNVGNSDTDEMTVWKFF